LTQYDQIYQDLQLLEKEMPNAPKLPRPDIFSISGFPHYETVLSNWFTYFLESNNQTGFSVLLAEVFQKIIQKKVPLKTFDWLTQELHISSEVITDKGGFIDLILFDELIQNGEKQSFENALIIEHKVEATLYNDLDDYFNSVQINPTGTKQGVVLSAKPIDIPNEHKSNFINITYQEVLIETSTLLGPYALESDLGQLNYFKDFLNNLNRMSEKINTEAVEFCFKHGETIQRVTELRQSAEEEIVNILRIALNDTNYPLVRRNPNSISLKTNDNNVTIIIGLKEMFSSKTFDFQYWLHRDGLIRWKNVPDHEELKEKFGHRFEFKEKKDAKDWLQLIGKKIEFEGFEELEQGFDQVLIKFLKTEIDPVTDFVRELMDKYNSPNA